MKKLLRIAASVVAALAALVVVAAYVYTHPGRGPKETVDYAANAYVEKVNDTPVIHLKGTPYEMGYQHGALCQERTRAGLDAFEALLELGQRETGLPVFVMNFLLDCVYRRCSPYIPEKFKRELEGLADGSGVDLAVLRRVHVISIVTERNCSSFAVFGQATADGRLFHGHNFDWNMDAGIQNNAALFLYEPEGGVPFAAYGYAGMIGFVSGMNMSGIAVGFIGAVTRDGRSSGLPLMLMARQVLEEAGSVEEARAIIEQAHRGVGYNYVIADGQRNEARAFETTAHHFAAFTDNDAKETCEYAIRIDDAVFRADEAMDPTVRSFQTCSNGYPNLPYGSNSYDHRYKGMADRIREHYGKIDQEIALEIVQAVAMRKSNLHSVLCDATHFQIWAAHAKGQEGAYTQPYVHFDLKKLFLRPDLK